MKLQILEVVQKLQKDNNRKEARFASLEAKIEQWEARMTTCNLLQLNFQIAYVINKQGQTKKLPLLPWPTPKSLMP